MLWNLLSKNLKYVPMYLVPMYLCTYVPTCTVPMYLHVPTKIKVKFKWITVFYIIFAKCMIALTPLDYQYIVHYSRNESGKIKVKL